MSDRNQERHRCRLLFVATNRKNQISVDISTISLFLLLRLLSLLRRHERNLCYMALSRLESAAALSQLLGELHETEDEEEHRLEELDKLEAETERNEEEAEKR